MESNKEFKNYINSTNSLLDFFTNLAKNTGATPEQMAEFNGKMQEVRESLNIAKSEMDKAVKNAMDIQANK